MVDPDFDALVTRSGETGAETREKYQYQDAFGIHLLLSPAYNYDEVWCEIGDDFLALRTSEEFHAFQIKTSTQEKRWRLGQEEIFKSLKNFVDLHERSDRMKRFFFVSNLPVEDLDDAHSPKLLAVACREITSAEKLGAKHSKSLSDLAKKTGCKPSALFEVLQKAEFVTGPSYQDWRAAAFLCVAHYRESQDLPGKVIDEWCERLRARFTEAASSKGERFGADRQKRRLGKEVLEETLAAVLRQPSMLSAVLGRDLQALRSFDGSVSNFIGYYVGDDQHPKIFAGRESELHTLNRWLAGGASQYHLVTSDAGLGKSALLVAWTRQALARGAADIVFCPVSHRFQTNSAAQVFRGLYLKLCAVLGRRTAAADLAGLTDWRKDFASVLLDVGTHPRTIVIVVDGLDEALDWQVGPDIFPANPPPNLRVLVAARPLVGDSPRQNWRTRLGWTRQGLANELEIEGLDKSGVAACVAEALPQLDEWAKSEVTTELMRLTGGDPLLLQFHLDSVDSTAISAEELVSRLRANRPGYEPFIENLFAAPARGIVEPGKAEQFLPTLAAALGPLTAEELREAGVPVPDFELMNLALRRLVVGDGVDQGFALSHPKLRDYFRSRAGPDAVAKIESGLIVWCRRVFDELLAGERPPADVPPYVLRHFGAHLQNESDTHSLVALAHERWAQAWLGAEVSYDGFLIDVRRAWDSLRDAGSAGGRPSGTLAALVRLALIVAKCQLPPISPELFAALVRQGNWTPRRALDYARVNPRNGFFEFLADQIPAEAVPAALDSLLHADVGPSVITITPERVRAAVRLLRRIEADARPPFVADLKDKVGAISLTPERCAALAHLLEFLDERERAEAAEEIAAQASNGKLALPFFFREAIPVLATTLGTHSPTFRHLVHAGVMRAFDSAADADLGNVIASRLKAGLAPSNIAILADVAPHLAEEEWKQAFLGLERILPVAQFFREERLVEFYEAALVHPPENDRARLVAQLKRVVEGELQPHFRARLLCALLRECEQHERQDYADELADLARDQSNASFAVAAMECASDVLSRDRQIQLIHIVDSLSASREEHMLRLLSFLDSERQQCVLAELIAAQRTRSDESLTWLARYAIAFHLGDSAAELTGIGRLHHITWRDFISEATWLPFGAAGPLLEVIDVTYLDKVSSEALFELFTQGSQSERVRFLAHWFDGVFQAFPPAADELDGVAMEFVATGPFVEDLLKKVPGLFPCWPLETWPMILAFLEKSNGRDDSISAAIIAAAYYAPRECESRVASLTRRLSPDAKDEALSALNLARPDFPEPQDAFTAFLTLIDKSEDKRTLVEPFLDLNKALSPSRHARAFRKCLEETQHFRLRPSKQAFRILQENFGKLASADRLPLLADWFNAEASRGWNSAMRALSSSAGMIAQAADAQELRTIRETIDEINQWFAFVATPTN